MKLPNKNQGYSLVEIIVYIAIFSVMSIVVINSFIVVTRSFGTTRANRDLLESGSVPMQRLAYEIRRAKSIDVADSTFGASPGVLALTSTDDSSDPETVVFVVEDGVLDLYENGVLVGPLTNSDISVDSLVFRHIVTTEGEAVKVEMTQRSRSVEAPVAAHFYDTITLQGQ